MVLSKAIELFLLEQNARGNTIKTILDYKQNLSYFYDFVGDINILDIDKSIIINYIVYLREKPKNQGHKNKRVVEEEFISSVTIQSYVRHLKSFLAWLYENEYIDSDVSKKFRLPKAKKEFKKILSDGEIKAIFKACKKSTNILRNELIISLMLYSGLRVNEVVLLKKSNYIKRSKVIIVFGKGQKERIVPLGQSTSTLLDKFLDNENKDYHYRKQEYLFFDSEEGRITYNAIRLMVDRIAKSSKVDRLHCHLLRHTFATRYLIKTKGDITSLKAILGHTSLKMVENYLHLATSYTIGQYRDFCDY